MARERRGAKAIELYLIRSEYAHWSNYSGAHQFIKHINRRDFKVYERAAPTGDSQFPIRNQYVRGGLKLVLKARGARWYGFNDFFAETAAFFDSLKQAPDILHYLDADHALQYLPSVMRRLRRFRRRPKIVATFHQPPHKLRWVTTERIIRSIDQAIVLSPTQAHFMKKILPANQVSLIPHGIDVDFWQPGNQKADGFHCLTVGTWMRDFPTLNEVARRVQPFPDIKFQVVSRKYTNDQGLNNVSVHTGISDERLRELYQQSHLLFLPLENATANNSILEAIACGLPVVTTDLPSTKYYLPADEAIFIADNDPDQFVEAIRKLQSSPDLRSAMSSLGRQRALELSWERIAEEHERLYSLLSTDNNSL